MGAVIIITISVNAIRIIAIRPINAINAFHA